MNWFHNPPRNNKVKSFKHTNRVSTGNLSHVKCRLIIKKINFISKNKMNDLKKGKIVFHSFLLLNENLIYSWEKKINSILILPAALVIHIINISWFNDNNNYVNN